MESVALMLALLAAPLRLPLVLTPPAPVVPSLPLGSVRLPRATYSNTTENIGYCDYKCACLENLKQNGTYGD